MAEKPLSPERLAARNKLVVGNLGLIAAALRGISKGAVEILGGQEDAYSHGYIALIRAAEHFDPAKGFKFSTFACRCIWNHLRRETFRLRSVKIPQKEWFRAVKEGHWPVMWKEWPTDPVSGEELDVVAEEKVDMVEIRSSMDVVWRAWWKLAPREREILRLRYLEDGRLVTFAAKHKMTKEGARVALKKALKALRAAMEPLEPVPQ